MTLMCSVTFALALKVAREMLTLVVKEFVLWATSMALLLEFVVLLTLNP